MKVLMCVLILLVVGCDVPDEEQCELYSTDATTVDAAGLVLHPSAALYLSFEEISSIYQEVEQCVGIARDGPDIYFLDFKTINLGGGWAIWHRPSGEIWVNTGALNRDCDTDRATLRHEFVHHILDQAHHASEFFNQCGG